MAAPYAPMGGDTKRHHGDGYDVESGAGYSQFMERAVRHGFIRKVYGILSAQLAFTFAVTFAFVLNQSVKDWVADHPGAFISAVVLQFVFIIILACVPAATRKVPLNYFLLFAFTAAESYLVGTASSRYDTDVVLIAFGLTMGITIGLTAFAFQTKWDFTGLGGYLFAFLWSMVLFGFMMIFFHSRVLSILYAWIGAILFSVYLVYDTQLMLGGKHRFAFSPDQYISAALNLYLDIVQLFLYLLRIISALKK